jgi:uncharacterized protein YbcI
MVEPAERDPQAESPETGSEVTDRGRVLSDISNAMVRLYKEDFGRGPTKARTYFAGPDVVICILRETFTRAERNLAAMGEHERLRDTRLFFQHATEREFVDTVQRFTGRNVVGFVSGTDTRNDIAVEVFLLEPTSDEAPHAGLQGRRVRGA